MPKFIELYQNALRNYIAQAERTHHSLMNNPEKRIFTFGLFSWFRHSQNEYPALLALRAQLEADNSDDQSSAIAAVKRHFSDPDNKWNHHSFNNYLLDEIFKTCSREEWAQQWLQFDKSPIIYYQGLLFRGTHDSPESIFRNGFREYSPSTSIEDYIKDMNGCVGVSTSKCIHVAHAYALPAIRANRDFEEVHPDGYIYVIDYDGLNGIDLARTFEARGRRIAAYLSRGKAEVNIIGHIPKENIVGAFYVNRNDAIVWHPNQHYLNAVNHGTYDALQRLIPREYFVKLPILAPKQDRPGTAFF